ncbi:MAG: PLP-dependent transferase [Deltaproteobacteria bacterium]|nr:PLP-dependent transferase [Deltaproteobacteria bacterium]MBK7066733.1 PLP-dependent transferase [Deltaproteobacteria bacterium]MBP6832162.1 PLP-dependent transferase [Deltaproteobacteria bacterium]
MKIETLAIHAGQHPDPTSGAVMTPIVLSSTFAQDGPGNHKGYDYSRSGNPTRGTLEACAAALEGARHGLAFASGCAATTTILHTLSPGDHIICGDDVYGGTFRIIDKVMKPMGITATFVDMTDLALTEAAFRPETKMVWLETPSNPMLKVFDIERVCAIASRKGVPVVVDNTFATPMIQQPLGLGATAVVHSSTKYLNGHSDVVGGLVMSNDDELVQKVRFLQNAMGAVPSPFDCFLVLRGLKTLPVRMDRHAANAQIISGWLHRNPDVARVYYPGNEDHPQRELIRRQMKTPGGMISFVIKGASGTVAERSQRFLSSLKVFTCAESLGGVESLIELPAVMTHASVPAETRALLGIDDGLIRISVGLEAVDDLIGDLDHAFSASR